MFAPLKARPAPLPEGGRLFPPHATRTRGASAPAAGAKRAPLRPPGPRARGLGRDPRLPPPLPRRLEGREKRAGGRALPPTHTHIHTRDLLAGTATHRLAPAPAPRPLLSGRRSAPSTNSGARAGGWRRESASQRCLRFPRRPRSRRRPCRSAPASARAAGVAVARARAPPPSPPPASRLPCARAPSEATAREHLPRLPEQTAGRLRGRARLCHCLCLALPGPAPPGVCA